MNKKNIVYGLITITTAPFLVLLFPLSMWSNTSAFVLALGSVTGFIGVVLLFWQMLLGVRFISSQFSPDYVGFNQLHKNLGKYGVIFVFVHPFLKALSYAGDLSFVLIPDFTDPLVVDIGYGRLAFTLLLVIWITSALLRGRIRFRPWKYIHLLAYPAIFLSLIHAEAVGTYLNSYTFLMGFWQILTYSFYVVLGYRLIKLAGFFKSEYLLVEKSKIEDITIYTFKSKKGSLNPAPGQFVYLQYSRFGEEHPFTVMENLNSGKVLKFGVKTEGKFTQKMSNLDQGDPIFVEGPFGVFTKEGQNQNPKVIIAGGIGVTPFVELVKNFSNSKTYMFNCNRFLKSAVSRDLFKQKLGKNYYDVISREDVSGENLISGRIEEETLKKYLPQEVFSAANYFICGSKSFYQTYKELLLRMGIPSSRIHYEEFGL